MNRRIQLFVRRTAGLLVLGGALTLWTAKAQAASGFDIRNEAEFRKIVPAGAVLRKLAGGMTFTEGPVWSPEDGGCLIFSDIPPQRLMRWSERNGLSVYREHTHETDGNCRDRQGRLISCEGGARRVTRTERNGSITILAEKYDGKKFNSPNDVVVKLDGTVWFSDPDYALGNKPREADGMYVYRLEPKTGSLAPVVRDCDHPNGLCFSPDEKRLYVVDSGAPRLVRVYDVAKRGELSNGRVFCVIDNGSPDGIRCDTEGRLYATAGDGVHIFDANGGLIGKILVPEMPANLAFGGQGRRTLYITARTSLYAIDLAARGIR